MSSSSPQSEKHVWENSDKAVYTWGATWNCIRSPKFAGICGLIGVLSTYLGLTIAFFLAASWFDPNVHYLLHLGYPYHIGGPFGAVGLNPSAPFYNGCQFICGIFHLIFGIHLLTIQIRRESTFGLLVGLLFIVQSCMPLCYGLFPPG
jgi:uncharacterized membrane protein HdeD (DUF308 family)